MILNSKSSKKKKIDFKKINVYKEFKTYKLVFYFNFYVKYKF